MAGLSKKAASFSTVITDVKILRPRESTWRWRRQLVAGWRHWPNWHLLPFALNCVFLGTRGPGKVVGTCQGIGSPVPPLAPGTRGRPDNVFSWKNRPPSYLSETKPQKQNFSHSSTPHHPSQDIWITGIIPFYHRQCQLLQDPFHRR